MITSGLILTLSHDPALADQALTALRVRPEFTPGERSDRWLPLALEAHDETARRDLHDWLERLPGIELVEVVQVNFEEVNYEH